MAHSPAEHSFSYSSYYQYSPLEDPKSRIRLITIRPGHHHEDIRCNIQSFSSLQLPEYPKYHALSYAWGDPTNKVPILLNDKVFLVTSNLEVALRNLRSSWRYTTHFWIDAICIDQRNYEERDEQVRRMKSIYENAQAVIVWLGDYEEPGDHEFGLTMGQWGLDALPSLSISNARGVTDELTGLSNFNISLRDASPDQRKEIITSLASPNIPEVIASWVQIARLFHRPWFERLWVIQELAFSCYAYAQFGMTKVPWALMELAASYILRPPTEVPIPNELRRLLPFMGSHRLAQVALYSMRGIDTENILTALWHTRGASCTDPRDKLYAILGMVNDIEDIDIDYTSPVETVYRNWAVRRITRTQSLDILEACADTSKHGTFPSWVPDLRYRWGQDKPLWNWTRQVSTLGDLPGERYFSFSDNQDALTLNGQYLARITALSSIGDATSNLSDPANLTTILHDIVTEWEEWAIMQRPPSVTASSTSADMQTVVFETALLRGGNFSDNEFLMSTRYRVWRRNRSKGPPNTDLDQEQDIIGNLDGQLFSMVHGSQVFATAGGNLGMVAANCGARVGDQLWLLMGGLTPFILREAESDRGYRLIAPCYFLNHMMHEKRAAVAGPVQKVTLI